VSLFVPPGLDTPLRNLGTAELRLITLGVPGTGGDVNDYKSYLPRILELLSEGRWDDWPDEEMVLSHLSFGGDLRSVPWTRWPPPERDAVARFLAAYGAMDGHVGA